METDEMAKIFKALSNEQRLKLFKMLYYWNETLIEEKESSRGVMKCFSMACDCMDLSRSTISHHFKELQNAGLITCTRNGQKFTCKINKDKIEAIKAYF